jgi:hypothetical protein
MKKIPLFLFCLSLALAASAGSALANLAANTAIINTARLTFDGGSANASVTVTVSLVPAQPNVTITDANSAYTAVNTPALTNSVRITATANGPASYTVDPSVSASTNTDLPSVSGGAAVIIGATVSTGTSGTTYVTVPASGASGNDAPVNGIAVNDTILFTVNGNQYTKQVTSTTDNGDSTFKLNWSGAIPGADVPMAGVQVGEQTTVNLSVLPGTVRAAGTNITVTVQAAVSTSGVADVSVSNSNANYWTTPSPNVNMNKYVRNLGATGNPAAGTGITYTINTVSREYFTSGVTGKPGDVLEYVIVAGNTGATDLTGAAISDLVPVDFVTFRTGVYGGDDVFYIDPDNVTATFTAAGVGANQASFVSPDLVVNVGIGAGNLLTGTIPAGKSVTVAYQVTIK